MTKISKKEVRTAVEEIIGQVLTKYAIIEPSKRTKKTLKTAARKVAEQVREEVKRTSKKTEKLVKKNSKKSKKVKNITVVAA